MLLITDVLLVGKMDFFKIIMIKNLDILIFNFDEFSFLKIGNWEGKINFKKIYVLKKKRNHEFLKPHIFILLHLIISSP